MAQANNRGFNQDYSCANSREFLPYLLLVSHWMPGWIWAKQGQQMDNKNWEDKKSNTNRVWQWWRIQPMMRQFDVCTANQKGVQVNTSWKQLVCFHLVKMFSVILFSQMSGQTQGRSVLFVKIPHCLHGLGSQPDPNFTNINYFDLIKAISVPIKAWITLEK